MYNKRDWLNGESSASTGPVVAYHGPSPWDSKKKSTTSFFEVSDCRNSCRLHKMESHSMKEYIIKIRKLQKAAKNYANYLESKVKNNE